MSDAPRAALRSHAEWLDLIDRSIALAEDAERCRSCREDVSGWTVGEHLEHLLLADEGITGLLESAVRSPTGNGPSGRPSTIGYLVVWTGYIPKGRGRAPDVTVPVGRSLADVRAGLIRIRERVAALEDGLSAIASERTTRPHPALGHFTPIQWLRFARIHDRHHHRIIDDVLKSGGDRGPDGR